MIVGAVAVLLEVVGEPVPDIIVVEITVVEAAVLLEFVGEPVNVKIVIGVIVVADGVILELIVLDTVDAAIEATEAVLVEFRLTTVVVGNCIMPQMFEKLLEGNGMPIACVIVG